MHFHSAYCCLLARYLEFQSGANVLWQSYLASTHQALESFEHIIGFSELQAYFVNCYDLCLQLQTREDWCTDKVKTRISVAIHMLGICRMAALIDFYWKILYVYLIYYNCIPILSDKYMLSS
jgi:hypothetical protein